MNRSSQQEKDAVVWSPAKLRLGRAGLDLRQPADGISLAKLINARFLNQETIERRNGYSGVRIRDAGGYPQVLDVNDDQITIPMTPDGWLYGHGQKLLTHPQARENEHLPIPGQAKGTFSFDGADIVWTGDRLLVVREDGYPALGGSDHWGIDNQTTILSHGVPAYIPVIDESTPVDTVTGDYVETCLTDSFRFVVASGSTTVTAWVTHRDTKAMIDTSQLDTGITPCDLRVFQSGAFVIATWRDAAADELYYSAWTGVEWTAKQSIGTNCMAYDVALDSGGFHVLWRDGTALHIGRFAGRTTQPSPYVFDTTIALSVAANGPVALDVAEDGSFVVVAETGSGLKARKFSASLTAGTEEALSALTTWNAGLTVRFRKLSRTAGTELKLWTYDVFGGRTSTVYHFARGQQTINNTRYNAQVASKAFRVGDRVFCWLRAVNSSTLFLVAVKNTLIVSGVADREEASQRALTDSTRNIAQVVQDPRDEHTFTFARLYDTGQDYPRQGNARIGDMNFLPYFSAVQYGKSVYIAGSLVRNWDGKELGDAGFHDYPIIGAEAFSNTGGNLAENSSYQYRVYAVRYNARGERFMGGAATHTVSTGAGGSGDSCFYELGIDTVPLTNHDDVVFEVYRTEANGTTFYLDGTVDNSLTSAQVQYFSTMSDADLLQQPADSHETGVAGNDEIEEFGPLGCAFLAVAADRLWGAGGQVPTGRVQFSKLKETVEGAGFDALAGWQEIDCEGGAITSFAGYADSLLVFERNRIYVLFGAGPDNYGYGSFGTPKMTLSDGATTHAGTVVTEEGVFFWGVDGPRFLSPALKVQDISDPVRLLTKDMTPTAVQSNHREVVWFTADGDAVLFNYAGQQGRWAQWTGLKVAACSRDALVTTDGVLLTEDADALGDNGVPFEYCGATGELDAEQLLLGHTVVREIGAVGKYLGPHRLRFRIYYNGSPTWAEQQVWDPADNTYLQSVEELGDLTAAQIDALSCSDQSGKYAFHKKLARHSTGTFRVEWSDIGEFRPTYRLHALVFELGAKGGLARIPANTFTRS
jgi:hypothetical protein